MKKLYSAILTLAVFLIFFSPVHAGEDCTLCRTGIVKNIDHDRIEQTEDLAATTVYLTMNDDRQYVIPVVFDKESMTAELEFASGKNVSVSLNPLKVEIIKTEGAQEFDDVENTTDFFTAYDSVECYIFLILCVTTGLSGIGLVFCYLGYVYCF